MENNWIQTNDIQSSAKVIVQYSYYESQNSYFYTYNRYSCLSGYCNQVTVYDIHFTYQFKPAELDETVNCNRKKLTSSLILAEFILLAPALH